MFFDSTPGGRTDADERSNTHVVLTADPFHRAGYRDAPRPEPVFAKFAALPSLSDIAAWRVNVPPTESCEVGLRMRRSK